MSDKKIDNTSNSYGDDAIVTLSPREHIRLRPGMYIGKLGDGSSADDGIYVLLKEVLDNSIKQPCICCCNGWSCHLLESKFKVICSYFRSIAPLRIFVHVESISKSIFTDIPALCCSRHDFIGISFLSYSFNEWIQYHVKC